MKELNPNSLDTGWDFQLAHMESMIHTTGQQPEIEFTTHPELDKVQEVRINKFHAGELWKNRYEGKWTQEPRKFRIQGWEMDPLLLELCNPRLTPRPMPLHLLQDLIRDRISEIRQARILAKAPARPVRQTRHRGIPIRARSH